MNELNERSVKNLEGVHPDLVKILSAAILDSPISFTVTEGIRTDERQKQLYAQGRTAPGIKVTNCDGIKSKSNHQPKADGYGYAVDIYANPINVNDTQNIAVVAKHIKEKALLLGFSVEWGGDWKMKDYPHFELK